MVQLLVTCTYVSLLVVLAFKVGIGYIDSLAISARDNLISSM